jgi:2-dehydro-3-deoxygluconokinase
MPLDMAGAESTVACYLAQLGVRAAWVSRVGDDPLGALVRDRVGGSGTVVNGAEQVGSPVAILGSTKT